MILGFMNCLFASKKTKIRKFAHPDARSAPIFRTSFVWARPKRGTLFARQAEKNARKMKPEKERTAVEAPTANGPQPLLRSAFY
ncbi:MAG: hypothetical protein K2H77_04150, partial [Alistipes sp.]|nr:hypothetical protein [Alistipes sp.]